MIPVLERSPALQSYYKHRESRLIALREYHNKVRKEVLGAYGGKCACCGFANMDKKINGLSFLQIDKIDGKHKRLKVSLGITGNVYEWLKNNNYPTGYRVL